MNSKKISSIHDDDSIEITVNENDTLLSCRLNLVSQYTPKNLYNFWRKQKNNANEKVDYEIPEKGTDAEKIKKLFDDNDNILYAKDTEMSFDSNNKKHSEIYFN